MFEELAEKWVSFERTNTTLHICHTVFLSRAVQATTHAVNCAGMVEQRKHGQGKQVKDIHAEDLVEAFKYASETIAECAEACKFVSCYFCALLNKTILLKVSI